MLFEETMGWFTKLVKAGLSLFKKPSTTTTTTTLSNTVTTTTTLGDKKMKKAFCFSINDYPGISNDLSGCNNDSLDWADLLKNQYGFDVRRITDSAVTKSAVVSEMTNLITNACFGDILVFTYSGHGTSVVDQNNDEIDGRDEAICLYDGFLIDDEIRIIFSKLPQGVHLTFISDSCHSGTVTRSFFNSMNDMSYISTPKYLPPQDDMEAIRLSALPVLKAIFEPREDMNEVLLAGCKSSEFSYDARFGSDNRPNGAFTYYAIQVLKQNPSITYDGFVIALNMYLPSSRYPQNPVCETNRNMRSAVVFS